MATTKATAKTAKAKSTAKAPVKSQATAQNPPVEETPEVKDLTIAEAPKEEFKSMCGFDYDPSQASGCFTACQKDNPEAFAACTENFKATAKDKKKVTKSRRGKNVFGHLIGCQGAKIDDIFTLEKGVHSMDDIMKYAEATRPRVISHLKHLVAVWNVDLRMTEDNKYFIKGYADGVEGKKHNGVKIIEVSEAPKQADKAA